MEIKINESLTITLIDNDADFKYRSHVNGNQLINPNNWVACNATGSDGNEYTAWYYVDTDIELDEIDYSDPNDVTDEYNCIVYDKDFEN